MLPFENVPVAIVSHYLSMSQFRQNSCESVANVVIHVESFQGTVPYQNLMAAIEKNTKT